jgi:hypothetical protein
MKLLPFLATIDIAALVKSESTRYWRVGTGDCLDSSRNSYDYAYRKGDRNVQIAAYNWCLSAVNYISGLVGGGLFDFMNQGTSVYWFCYYDNGTIDNMKNIDFNPEADQIDISKSGIGAIRDADYINSYKDCFSNLVSVKLFQPHDFIPYLLS